MDEKKTARPRGTDSARVIRVIVTEALEGCGTKDDPCRTQKKYWSLDGKLLAVGVSEDDSAITMRADQIGELPKMLGDVYDGSIILCIDGKKLFDEVVQRKDVLGGTETVLGDGTMVRITGDKIELTMKRDIRIDDDYLALVKGLREARREIERRVFLL